jgi:hypothetical protein
MSGRLLLAALLAAIVALAVAGCNGSSEGISSGEVVKALHLQRSGDGYAMNGDEFCQVSELLTSSDDVSTAAQSGKKGLLIASRQGSVGIKVVPPFAPDCRDQALKALNGLDRPSKNE